METNPSLQLILGTDKRNPCLTVATDEAEQRFHVYYGFEVLEVIPNDREALPYKLMVAQLYNARLKVKALEETFQVNHKTMARWGEAVRSGNPEELLGVLLGRQNRRKFSPAIQAYVRAHWPQIQAAGGRRYSRQTQEEVYRVFGVKISGVTLRPLLKELRQQRPREPRVNPAATPPHPPAGESSSPAEPAGPQDNGPAEESAADEGLELFPQLLGPVVPEPPAEPQEKVPLESIPTGLGLEPSLAGSQTVTDQQSQFGELTCALEPGQAGPKESTQPLVNQALESVSAGGGGAGATRKVIPLLPVPSPLQTMYCDHLGMLLFWGVLLEVAGAVADYGALLKQWLACIFLGAVNIEQTRFLNWNDLHDLLGPVLRSPEVQRRELTQSAHQATVEALFRLNARRLAAPESTDLYLDPHTKHYTGLQDILKGWCPGIGHADKALHCDFLHSARGEPLYFEITDNYADLRERLPALLERCRQTLNWPKDRVLTVVVDRAVFSRDFFATIQADPALHLITWEKGYQPEGCWPTEPLSGTRVIERSRNRADDQRVYRFEYIDESWSRQSGLRRLRVRATNPAGRRVELAILTDDLTRAAGEIIGLMFQRWLQENDFKYQIKHFGLNQIVSYQVVPYEQLSKQLADRQVESEAYRALAAEQRGLRSQQGHLLVEQERSARHAAVRQKRLEQLAVAAVAGQPPEAKASGTVERNKLLTAQARHEANSQLRRGKIAGLNEQLAALEAQLAQTQKEVSRLNLLVAQNRVRLDSRNKRLMDLLKIIARNSFYQALAPFKRDYNNYRNDHVHFRQLTHSGGVLEPSATQVTVHLLPRVNYPRKLRGTLERYLEQVNQTEPKMPDGSGRRLVFRLARRSDFKLTLA